MNRSLRALLTAIVSSALAPTVAPGTVSAQATVATERTVVFAVENMICALCPITVKTAMERVPGVRSVVIDFDAKTATVVFDPSGTTEAAIAAAAANVGYPARALRS